MLVYNGKELKGSVSDMYDVIVVGGGHAGIEASLAPSRMGLKTLLVTSNINNIGSMPCNTSIGGPAKGIIVREIDALGGQMSKTADKTYLQMKMLNTAKGPGVQSLRAQADKKAYPRYMQKVVKEQENLDLIEGMVEDLVIEDQTVKGVILDDGTTYLSKTVILTTGTYLKAEILVGHSKHANGPDQQKESKFLSGKLKDYGFRIQRLKTGTPPRVEINSIDYSKTSLQPGTNAKLAFSFTTDEYVPIEKQTPCYLTYTNETTHKIIHDNLEKCAMYSGLVKGIGPRYCPSIEDKLVRFKDKPRHLLFLEPESLELDTIYLQGFSTSLPRDIQEKMVHSLPGFENAIIKKYAYAIEYDAIDPIQMKPSFESKIIENLFTAGQVNGTSGYEEAAGQGLLAGINACMKLDGKEPLILARNEAYIGVLVDDLTTKGTLEPYRLLTSRAEFRLLLRHGNADQRLIEYGRQIGLVSQERYDAYLSKMENIKKLEQHLSETTFVQDEEKVYAYLTSLGYESDAHIGINGIDLVKRPNVTTKELLATIGEEVNEEIANQCDIELKYAGYIDKAKREANKLKEMDGIKLGVDFNYDEVDNLSIESRQKLTKYKPATMGQASRISGVNPADIAVLAIAIKQGKGR